MTLSQVGSSSSARHHDSKILCHLRHRDRVRSSADRRDRPARSSSLPNNDSQPAKAGESLSPCLRNAISFLSMLSFIVPVNYFDLFFASKHVQCVPSAVCTHRSVAGVAPAGVCKWCFYLESQAIAFDMCGFI